MTTENEKAVAVLDTLIAEKEREVSRLRLAVSRLQQASTDLSSLRRTREILSGEPDSQNAQLLSTSTSVAIDPYLWGSQAYRVFPAKNVTVTQQKEDPTKGVQTLSDRVEVIMRAEGKPMHVEVITDKLHQQGLSAVNKQTVTAILARETKKEDGRFIKTVANTFDLRERKNG
jgi:hypothetical protein